MASGLRKVVEDGSGVTVVPFGAGGGMQTKKSQ